MAPTRPLHKTSRRPILGLGRGQLILGRALYIKIKSAIAAWRDLTRLTQHGRVMLANFMIYSRPRYWAQAMLPPPHFNRQLEQDVHHASPIVDKGTHLRPDGQGPLLWWGREKS
eukprot:scaffold5515_cov148-Isochrysis_galbana.AAC.3